VYAKEKHMEATENNCSDQIAHLISHRINAPLARMHGLVHLMNNALTNQNSCELKALLEECALDLIKHCNHLMDVLNNQRIGNGMNCSK
jgi:nitrogen-specific signal transduction histidine kinase